MIRMPRYDYFCEKNQRKIEVVHSIHEKLLTWGEVCRVSGIDPGDTPLETPVKRLLSPVAASIPTSNSKLSEKGFTKLVRRERGVYENVTATGKEKRVFRADDPTSFPDLKRKIKD
jgi:hypothetical protein